MILMETFTRMSYPLKTMSIRSSSNITGTFEHDGSGIITRTNCPTVRSGSDIQLTALESKLQRADERCNSIKKRLDYYKMLYRSAGPTADMTTQLPYLMSPRSSRVESPRIPSIPIIDELRHDIENIDTNQSIQDRQSERAAHSSRSKKVESYIAIEIHKNESTDQLITNAWNEKSPQQIYSISNNELLDSSNPEFIETLPREPEVVLKLSDRHEGREKSARDKIIKPRRLYSTINAAKPESSRRDDSPVRLIKKKRRKTKLKRSNSKSTTASKYAVNLSETRHIRRIKRRVHKIEEPQTLSNNTHQQKKTLDKSEQEVVEIYHNAAAQSMQSFSESSIKPQLKIPQEKPLKDAPKNVKNSINPAKALVPKIKSNQVDTNSERKIPLPNDREAILRQREAEVGVKNGYEELQSQPMRTWCYNSFVQPNYQQPTFASKLKCVDRCYLTARFNLRNIPFVVGTSITPSHNLGLNIQQVLSLMKNKQPGLATEMRPFFIKKVGKELHPFSSVEGIMQDQVLKRTANVGNIPGLESVGKIDQIDQKNIPEGGGRNSIMQQKQDGMSNVECRLPRYPGITSNSSAIRDVLMRLHYKFEEMQTKYEELQEKSKKTKDEALQKELRELEDELNAKESEISAVVGLYNEVMALKSQIHGAYHQKNSLLCIAEDYSTKIPPRIHQMNNLNHQRPRTSLCGVRIPSTSTRLTGLLRQIQSFQQQLMAS